MLWYRLPLEGLKYLLRNASRILRKVGNGRVSMGTECLNFCCNKTNVKKNNVNITSNFCHVKKKLRLYSNQLNQILNTRLLLVSILLEWNQGINIFFA